MARKKHGTLTANTVATVTVDGPHETLVVLNHGATEIYARHGRVAADVTAPVVQGDDNEVVPANGGLELKMQVDDGESHVVKLISAGTPEYSVLAGETL